MPADDRFAAELRGFGAAGIVAILVIVVTAKIFIGPWVLPIGAMLVLAWAKLSKTPWEAIGYTRLSPLAWVLTVVGGIAFGLALKLAMKAIVMPLLGADPVNQAYHHLAGNQALIAPTIWAMLVAGFAEETIFRGFAFERLGKLIGKGAIATTVIVLVTSAWFALSHYPDQGLAGTEQALVTGLVFGAIFAVTGRIWLPMIAHASFDLAAYAMIYFNLETAVAHSLCQ